MNKLFRNLLGSIGIKEFIDKDNMPVSKLREMFRSERGIRLITQEANERMLTVEDYSKWYDFYLIDEFKDVIPVIKTTNIDTELWNLIGENWYGHFMRPEGFLLVARMLNAKVDEDTYYSVIDRYIEDVGLELTNDFLPSRLLVEDVVNVHTQKRKDIILRSYNGIRLLTQDKGFITIEDQDYFNSIYSIGNDGIVNKVINLDNDTSSVSPKELLLIAKDLKLKVECTTYIRVLEKFLNNFNKNNKYEKELINDKKAILEYMPNYELLQEIVVNKIVDCIKINQL